MMAALQHINKLFIVVVYVILIISDSTKSVVF